MAAETGSIDCVLLLLHLGADVKPLADQNLFSSVVITGSREYPERSMARNNLQILSLLCEIVQSLYPDSEADVRKQELLDGAYSREGEEVENCGSPLELALSVQNYHSVLALLHLGANPNAFNHMPPLHIAVSLREPILTCLLLSYGADPELRYGELQRTALHFADTTSIAAFSDPPRNELTSYADYLPEDVEPVDTEDEASVTSRVKACIAVLLHFGSDVNACDDQGLTTLLLRVTDGDLEVAEYLFQNGGKLYGKPNGDGKDIEAVVSEDALRWCQQRGLVGVTQT